MGEEGERLVGENLLKDEGSESGGDGAGGYGVTRWLWAGGGREGTMWL
jgi:hypothetical protein